MTRTRTRTGSSVDSQLVQTATVDLGKRESKSTKGVVSRVAATPFVPSADAVGGFLSNQPIAQRRRQSAKPELSARPRYRARKADAGDTRRTKQAEDETSPHSDWRHWLDRHVIDECDGLCTGQSAV
jgi:hypothetical protein